MAKRITEYPFFGMMVFITVCMLAQLSILGFHLIAEKNNRSAATAYQVAWEVVEVSRLVLATPPGHQIYSIRNLNGTVLTTGNSNLAVTLTDKPKYQKRYNIHMDLLTLHDDLLKQSDAYRISLKVTDNRWLNFHEQRVFIFPLPEMLLMLIEVIIVIGLWAWFIWKYRTFRSLAELAAATKTFHSSSKKIMAIAPSATAEIQDMAAALLQLQEKVKSLLDDRALLLGLASHDLRGILTRLKMRTEMLPENEQRTKLLNNIKQMNELLQHLLEYSGEYQKQDHQEMINLSDLLPSIITQFKQDGADIIADHIDNDLPIYANSSLVKLAISNVVCNACKYGTKIWLQAHSNKEEVIVIVYDNGSGIPSSEKEKIFTPHYRGNQAEKTEGLGLGLTLAKNVILDADGSIELRSNKPSGLKVIISLPKYNVLNRVF